MQVFANVLTSAHAWNSEEPLLIYSVPPDMQHELQTGQLIAVPYGDRLVEGIVWKIWEEGKVDEVEDMIGHTASGYPISGHPQGVSLHLKQPSERNQNVGAPLAGVPDTRRGCHVWGYSAQ